MASAVRIFYFKEKTVVENFNQHQFINDLYECEQYKYLLQKRKEEIETDIKAKTKKREYVKKLKNETEFQVGLESIQKSVPKRKKYPEKNTLALFCFFAGGIRGGIIGFLVGAVLTAFLSIFAIPICIVVGVIIGGIIVGGPEISDRLSYNKRKKEYEKSVAEHDRIFQENIKAAEKYEQEYYQRLEEENAIGAKELELSENQRVENYYNSIEYKALENEISVIDESYSNVENKLNQLYALRDNGALCIHPNYHGLVPISVIYGYFDTGRCTSLTGPDGAYNLYEDEKFKGMIVNNLNTISSKLDTLNNTMYYVGLTLNNINRQLITLNQTAFQIANSVNSIDMEILSINDNLYDIKSGINEQNIQLKDISKNTKNIAYYEKTNAKINAINVMLNNNLNQLDLNTKIGNIY